MNIQLFHIRQKSDLDVKQLPRRKYFREIPETTSPFVKIFSLDFSNFKMMKLF